MSRKGIVGLPVQRRNAEHEQPVISNLKANGYPVKLIEKANENKEREARS